MPVTLCRANRDLLAQMTECWASAGISQRPTIMHTAVHNLVPQRLVHALGQLIVDPCIRRHLNTPLAACPIFCRGQKSPTYSHYRKVNDCYSGLPSPSTLSRYNSRL
jgi:hypothetical protein